MTRAFQTQAVCSSCGEPTTLETPFERWMRGQSDLDSIHTGLVRFDLDLLLHRYKVSIDGRGTRELQCLMFVEVKTFLAQPTRAQADTLGLLDQVLRNRRQNMHQDQLGRHALEHVPPARAFSVARGTDIQLWLRGGHLLQLERELPRFNEEIRWDNRQVDLPTLKGILRFEIDADSLQPVDMRRRYEAWGARQTEFPI